MTAVRDRFTLQGGTGDFPSYAVAGKGVILRRRGNHVFFLELRRILELRRGSQASSPFRTPTAGSLQSWDRRVRPRLD